MKDPHGLKQQPRKTIAVGFGDKSESVQVVKRDLVELHELIYALGWEVVGSLFQRLEPPRPATLLGPGKINEILQLVEETKADCVVVDHQLSGSQLKNLSEALEVVVADRSQVIIDIFAMRAQSKEGKLQVELARLLDELPRMIGGWHGSLSRLGGGIGTRGPGESALETDRRAIRSRINLVKDQLIQIQKHRKETKKNRSSALKIALLGYTNAGKSSLLKVLSGKDTYIEDQLFATLDPLTRKVFIEDLGEAVITDTVGFINKIPTHLIEAFKATLEESADADIILHVIDCSDPDFFEREKFVEDLIDEFDWNKKTIVQVYNKIDTLAYKDRLFPRRAPSCLISTQTLEGIPKLKEVLIQIGKKTAST